MKPPWWGWSEGVKPSQHPWGGLGERSFLSFLVGEWGSEAPLVKEEAGRVRHTTEANSRMKEGEEVKMLRRPPGG